MGGQAIATNFRSEVRDSRSLEFLGGGNFDGGVWLLAKSRFLLYN